MKLNTFSINSAFKESIFYLAWPKIALNYNILLSLSYINNKIFVKGFNN